MIWYNSIHKFSNIFTCSIAIFLSYLFCICCNIIAIFLSISVLSDPNSSMLIPARYKLLICSAGFQTGRSAHICYSLYFVYLTIFPNKASRNKPAILSKFGHDIYIYLTAFHSWHTKFKSSVAFNLSARLEVSSDLLK